MKIGVDIRSLEDEPSGVSEYAESLLKNILELDSHNQYFLFYNSYKKNTGKLRERFPYPNCQFVFFNIPNKAFNMGQTLLRRPKIDRMIGDLDLLFMPNINFASFSKKVKTVVTAHDLSYKYFPGFFSFKRRLWHRAVAPGRIFRSADRLIAVSTNTKQDLVKLFQVPANKIEVIYSGVNSPQPEPSQSAVAAIKAKYGLGDNFILSLSNIEPRKNIESLILAYNQIRDRGYKGQLIIAGKPSWSYHKIFSLAKRSPFQNDIKFLGYVAADAKDILYRLSDLFVYPSFYEGFGFPPLESMIQGTPVITSFNSSLPEVVSDAALLVDPYNINEIAAAMSLALFDKSVRHQMISKGQEAATSYTWKASAQKTIDLFNQLNTKS
ncbi:MAG: glycosyltransferase family 1 protein [Patescibacteria group bacterium]